MIEELFKEEFKALRAYEPLKGSFRVKLDANESFLNPSGEVKTEFLNIINTAMLNHYPDPEAKGLCRAFSSYSGVDEKNIIAGNGSDELIQMIVNAFIGKGDRVLTVNPDFSMYNLYTKIGGGINLEFPLDEEFKFNVEKFIKKGREERVKLIILSNPNNPTGGVIPVKDIVKILEESNSIVVIDEAYFEFYGNSVIDKIDRYDNLIVLRTCSKAFGLAALRIGFLAAGSKLINEIKKVKPPFNVNTLSQEIGRYVLGTKEFLKNINMIKQERNFLTEELEKIDGIKVYPTEANFILIKISNAAQIQSRLLEKGIWVRAFSNERLRDYLRVSAGSRTENTAFLEELRREING